MDGRRLATGGCPGKGETQPASILDLPFQMFHVARMTTVHEEKVSKPDNLSEDKGENGEEVAASHQNTCSLPASRTCDSLQELTAPKLPLGGSGGQAPGNSPSLVSSGYGSQAASSTNLSR